METLQSQAEILADETRTLPQFKNFSLLGMKDKVASVLRMVGQEHNIFSTYTIHDISHANVMLDMLDWIIPSPTKEIMSPVDWLMTVLAIYLHDLGMFVTREEYEKRMENPEFCLFLEELNTKSEEKDYLARIKGLAPEDIDPFFYQEFIRKEHATRIKEWITGRHTSRWSKSVKSIADAIAEMLDALPARFRENLGMVCESHHRDNLDKLEYFPLFQRYGNDSRETANVQYSALLLRTTDLLHVTKDRTPSIMYKLIHFSDPKGIDEWKKQMGTFSVYMKSRDFDPNDPDSHIIVVSADFTEERPYFALTEYLIYADQQIQQTKRWADSSQNQPDGKLYFFPWEKIKGDIRVEGHEPVPMSFELDRGRLLDLLVGHTIYNDPTVAIRELLQNAIDAVRFKHHLAKKEKNLDDQKEGLMGSVQVYWRSHERELAIIDNGIGMDLEIIKYHLMRVGSSFYNTTKFQNENSDFTPISRFGIGVLTCFMVSDDIEIITCQNNEGYRIRMTSVHAEYLLKRLEVGEPLLEEIQPHGTKVTLKFRPSIDLSKKSILDILRYWIILPACEVFYYEDSKEPERIGYDTPVEAIRHLYLANNIDDIDSDLYPIMDDQKNETSNQFILTSNFYKDGGKYQLTYVLNKSFTPERSFHTIGNANTPSVCIEGIRVDNRLPGFQNRPNRKICALLSVQGNKKFQTTVSRSGLEVDEEYFEVSKICAKLLFNHVKEEVERISQQSGHPLSQASSAGLWLYDDLFSFATQEVETYLESLFYELPIIVIERIESNREVPHTDRNLINQSEFKKLDHFWTIESRLVDYLGIISRDLGRELSLNNFLVTLAPEIYNPDIDPVILDAQEFDDIILSNHKVYHVEYSVKHQHSMIEWKFKEDKPNSDQLKSSNLINDQIINELNKILGVFNTERTMYTPIAYQLKYYYNSFFISKIKGDFDNILGLKTRIATVIDPRHPATIILQALDKVIEAEFKKGASIKDIALLFSAIGLIFITLSYKSNVNQGVSGYGSQSIKSAWNYLIDKINSLLKHTGSDIFISDNLESIVGDRGLWFDASSYWRVWNRNERAANRL